MRRPSSNSPDPHVFHSFDPWRWIYIPGGEKISTFQIMMEIGLEERTVPLERIFKPGVTMQILKENQIKPLQRLGQNFLIDGNILEKIVAAADLSERDRILEIGPGVGALTQVIVERCGRLVAIEIDKRLVKVLREVLAGYDNLEIIEGDVLREDLGSIMGDSTPRWKVVANLPYYITSPILMRMIEERDRIERMVVMVQREVAQRIIARPGGKDYGLLSVFLQYYCEVSIVHDVPPTAFFPRPDVGSSVVLFKILKAPRVSVGDERVFSQVVKAAFGKRRKTILNALSNSPHLLVEKELVLQALEEAGVAPDARAETLIIEEFAAISRGVAKRLKGGNEDDRPFAQR